MNARQLAENLRGILGIKVRVDSIDGVAAALGYEVEDIPLNPAMTWYVVYDNCIGVAETLDEDDSRFDLAFWLLVDLHLAHSITAECSPIINSEKVSSLFGVPQEYVLANRWCVIDGLGGRWAFDFDKPRFFYSKHFYEFSKTPA